MGKISAKSASQRYYNLEAELSRAAAGRYRPALSAAPELRLGQTGAGDLAQPKWALEKAEKCTDPSHSTEEQSQPRYAGGRCTTWV